MPIYFKGSSKYQAINGKDMKKLVTAAGYVYNGDFVRDVEELSILNTLRIAIGAKIVEATLLGDKKIAVIFTQNGNTYVKAIKYTDQIVLGNTVLFLEGTELVSASMTAIGTDKLAIFYNDAAGGEISLIEYSDLLGSVTGEDPEVFDVYDPAHITVSALDSSHIIVCYTRTATEYNNRVFTCIVTVDENTISVGAETELVGQYTDDTFESHAWTICAVNSTTAIAAYFKDYDSPTQYHILTINDTVIEYKYSDQFTIVGSIPSNSLVRLNDEAVGMASASTKIAEGTETKNTVIVEGLYVDPKKKGNSQPYFWGSEKIGYSNNVGAIDISRLGDEKLLVTYMVNNELRCTIVTLNEMRPKGVNPTVVIDTISSYGKIVPINGSYAISAYSKDNNVYVSSLKRISTVITCDSDEEATGIAKGTAGPKSEVLVCGLSLI